MILSVIQVLMNMSRARIWAGRISGALALIATVLVISCGGGNSEAGPSAGDLGIIVTQTPGPATALPRRTSHATRGMRTEPGSGAA
jgi:hypothetical protein